MKKIALIILVGLPILGIAYFAGPKIPRANYDLKPLPSWSVPEAEKHISSTEALHRVKPGNEARIVWAGKPGNPTENVVVYLHGFSASHEEGNPVHLQTAKNLSANLYLPRLSDHGIDTLSPMAYFTPERLWASAKDALAVGHAIGNRVTLIGTSTGGSLALQLAAAYPEQVDAVILLSPNIAINDPAAFLLNDPWGLQIARQVLGSNERVLTGKSAEYKKYWYTNYRIEAIASLQEYIESTMHSRTFNAVQQPVLLLYYFKNEAEQDPVVKVSGMLKMFDELGTITTKKVKKALPGVGNHVIGSSITSKDLPAVQREIDQFLNQLEKK